MGEVYEAEHLEHGRRIALKILKHSLAGSLDRVRFLREGRLAASITHPNSVYVYGTEVIDGFPAIAMEIASGGCLKDRVDQSGPLPPAQAVDAILQAMAGLKAAQAAGVLHRDIKPSNLFVDTGGTVKIGDFGLSVSNVSNVSNLSMETQLTATGMIIATPAFAPPEQLRGDEMDVRTGFKDADGFAGVACLKRLKSGGDYEVHSAHANQWTVFDYKDDSLTMCHLFFRVSDKKRREPEKVPV